MIIDLEKFIERERPAWDELDRAVGHLESEPVWRLDLARAKRLHYLYERASAGLARINTFSSDPDVRRYLESLVARAYGEIHSIARPRRRLAPAAWFFGTFPRTFRRHIRAFCLATAVMLAGGIFGGFAMLVDPDAKAALLPRGGGYEHLQKSPSQRVREEEQATGDRLAGRRIGGSAFYAANNTVVAVVVLALGVTFGLGTIVKLFHTGVMLGVLTVDYVMDGQTAFLVGWLLPHGSVEIPAILLAGQAGLVLGSVLIGRRERRPLKVRLRRCLPDLVTLTAGVAILLIWAGIIEAFFSQYHEPVLPYWLKISFGCAQLVVLFLLLGATGRRGEGPREGQ